MVEITVFELHLEEGIEIGPKTIGTDSETEGSGDVSTDPSGRGKLALLVLGAAGLLALALAAARRVSEDNEVELEVEGVN